MNNDYLAYMLRFKRATDQSNWRASLENAHTGKVRHFATHEDLILFLLDRLNKGFPLSDLDEEKEDSFQ